MFSSRVKAEKFQRARSTTEKNYGSIHYNVHKIDAWLYNISTSLHYASTAKFQYESKKLLFLANILHVIICHLQDYT